MKNYKVNLFVDSENIGFDIVPEMSDYDYVVAVDENKPTSSTTLAINIQGEYLKKVLEKMGDEPIHVLTVYVLLFNLKINRLQISGKNNDQIVKFTPQSNTFYGTSDLTGTGCALYVDSYYFNNTTQKPIEKCVKVEIRTFKNPDGSNWTVACTEQVF